MAMGLNAISSRRSVSAHYIFSVRDGFQMKRIHASAIPTKMIDDESGRNGANEIFIRESCCSLGESLGLASPEKYCIPLMAQFGVPAPAKITRDYMTPEIIDDFHALANITSLSPIFCGSVIGSVLSISNRPEPRCVRGYPQTNADQILLVS